MSVQGTVTVSVTGTVISPSSGSSLEMIIFASYVSILSSLAPNVTVTAVESEGRTVPESGSKESQSMGFRIFTASASRR